MIERRELTVNKDYQRSSDIWPEGPSSYFIDTILQSFPFPKIFMFEHLDRQARSIKKEIVDGQQRIGAMQRFYSNQLTLRGDGKNAGHTFQQLDEEEQNRFLTYSVAVDVISSATSAQILQMFRRMNSYTLPLNEAEKRHSAFQGAFKWFVNELSDKFDEFFVQFGVFTDRQLLRMSDSAFIADCILAIERGVVSASARDLSNLYESYDSNMILCHEYNHKMSETIQFIAHNFSELRRSFMMKPYALHSLVTTLIYSRFGIDSITREWKIIPIGQFAKHPESAQRALLAMSLAHEAKELNGVYGKYVWGCVSTTDRKNRRTARIAAVLRVLGVDVPETVDANLA